MVSLDTLQYELRGRFVEVEQLVGKHHLSIRWEPGPAVVRVGACLEHYTLDARNATLETLLSFEDDHSDDFAVEFDIIPLDTVRDEEYAEA